MRKLVSVLLTLAVAVSLMVVPAIVSANPDSYTTDTGNACWTVPLNITETPPGWGPLTVDVSYADGKATFVITPPVAFNPDAPNDNFWLVFDTDSDGVEDFQALYNTRLPSEDLSQTYNYHWAKKTYTGSWSNYQEIPDDWDVSATSGLDQFTVSIPVSYLGGANSNYGFQIGLVKYVYETDWQTEWGDIDFDPICEGWSTLALIFVPLPSEGWETETIPANTAVGLTANIEDIVAINVDPTSIDFGTLKPGEESVVRSINIENIGTHTVDVDAYLTAWSSNLFKDNLMLKNEPKGWADWGVGTPWNKIVEDLAMGASDEVKTKLPVPLSYTPSGVETGKLIFEAVGV
ncbi:MAG: hypothetical protein J7L78_03060 [Dehalococcoidales bacterium]|nr:hypothetical protein [Dehalococcoidales bacterium]